MVEVDFSQLYDCINKVYHPYVEDFRRIQIFKGGGSAGKSRFIAQRAIYRLITIPGYNGVCVRNVRASNHQSTFAELCSVIEDWGLRHLFKINEADGKEKIVCKHNGNQVFFRGLDDPEKIKSITIKGGGLVWIWVEEASEIDEKSFNQLLIRIRGVGVVPKHIILSFNPIDSDHWIKTRFFDNPINPKKGFICESTYKDNEYLTEDDKETLEAFKEIDYYYYQVYCLNEWGSISQSKVFQNLKIYDFDIPDYQFKNKRAGEDFGWTHPQVFIKTGWIDGELYIYDEIVEYKTINAEFIKLILASGHPPEMPITCDYSDPGAIEENNNAGLIAYAALKGPGSIDRGVKWLKRLPAIHINKSKCPTAARQFAMYKCRETKDGKIFDNQYVEINDDTIDAVRYANEDLINSLGDEGSLNAFPKAYA